MSVKGAAVFCAVGFVVIQVLYLGVWCVPFSDYWALPVPEDKCMLHYFIWSPFHPFYLLPSTLGSQFANITSFTEQCQTYTHHMVVTSVFHLSSDLMMMMIPIPIVWTARLPLRRKIPLVAVFGLGLANIVVAALNRYYNFSLPDNLIFLVWYNAEASTAVIVANMPMCWSLIQRVFKPESRGAPRAAARPAGGPSRRASVAIRMQAMRRRNDAWELVEEAEEDLE